MTLSIGLTMGMHADIDVELDAESGIDLDIGIDICISTCRGMEMSNDADIGTGVWILRHRLRSQYWFRNRC